MELVDNYSKPEKVDLSVRTFSWDGFSDVQIMLYTFIKSYTWWFAWENGTTLESSRVSKNTYIDEGKDGINSSKKQEMIQGVSLSNCPWTVIYKEICMKWQ